VTKVDVFYFKRKMVTFLSLPSTPSNEFSFFKDQVDLLKPRMQLEIHNGAIEMIHGVMHLVVDDAAARSDCLVRVIDDGNDSGDIQVNLERNLSLIEYQYFPPAEPVGR
jgi:hypothetical protein